MRELGSRENARTAADLLGSLAALATALNHAEADVLCPVTAQPNGRLTSGSAELRALTARIFMRRAGMLIHDMAGHLC